ncbi:MAG: RagB/SusD family nutrient uptake outer membrane protein [Bacteroidales bacterium]|nr:RagB/SusD family nutrient uptake outer membrane protein [Bacteroidales bacterium]
MEFPYWNDLQFTSNENKIESTYMYLFRGVYRVNIALEKIPGIEMDNSLKQRLLAEAKFLRAFYYFHLRVYFNKPPLVLKVISSYSESKLPNATAAEI